MLHPPTGQLVARARVGDMHAFGELARRYRQFLLMSAAHLTRDRSRAEDVAQEVLLAAMDGLRDYRDDGEFTTWLYRLVHNRVVSDARRSQVDQVPGAERALEDTMRWSEQEATLDPAERDELRQALAHAINELPASLLGVFTLRAFEGESTAATARQLRLSNTVVKARMFHARLVLQRRLARFWRKS